MLLSASCKQENSSAPAGGVSNHGDTVIVSATSAVQSHIKHHTVTLRDISSELYTTGKVKAIAGQMAEIAPLFDGRVMRSFVRLGEPVKVGDPLFEFHSAAFSEIVKTYFQSLQAKKTKALNLRRQQDLVRNGAGVVKEAEEAEAEYEMAQKEYENAAAYLRMLNIAPDSIRIGEALVVASPIAGEVVQMNIVIGQYVKSDAAPLAIVAELGKVWVAAQVKEKDIRAIRRDARVEIRTDADPQRPVAGYVAHISELLDEETRSVQVLITCDNSDRALKPGMFASVRFIHPPQKSIVIPSAALLQDGDEAYVFVQAGAGRYLRRTVEAVTANLQEVLITDGLEAGETVVAEGSIYLMGR